MSFSYAPLQALGIGLPTAKSVDYSSLGEIEFHRMVSLERRRTSRSRKSSLLMLIDMGETPAAATRNSLRKILSAMRQITRETDITGWYRDNSVIGVMFTEITFDDHTSIPPAMMTRLNEMLKEGLTPQELRQININFHFLSELGGDALPAPETYVPVYKEVPIPMAASASL